METFPIWYLMLWAGVFGALTASFLTVVAERVPRGLSIGGRSHCVCGRQLKVTENLPIVGFLRVRGVAPCCQATIPPFYVLAELVLAAAWAAAPLLGLWGLVWMAVTGAALVGVGRRALNPVSHDR